MHVVANAAAASRNRLSQGLLDGVGEAVAALQGDPVGRAQRRDAGAEQGFRRIDVADADHQRSVHQDRLDGLAAPGQRRVQPAAVELGGERLGAERGEQRVPLDVVAGVPGDEAEAARIPVAEQPIGQDEVYVVVALRWGARRDETQAAGHAEVDDQRAAPGRAGSVAAAVDQQVFGTAADGIDRAAAKEGVQPGVEFDPQPRAARDRAEQLASFQQRGDAQAADFDLGEFRHVL